MFWWPWPYFPSCRALTMTYFRERSGSVVECLTWDQRQRVRASPASLRCGPWARHIYHSLVRVQSRKTSPCLTEGLLMGRKESNQTNKSNDKLWQQKACLHLISCTNRWSATKLSVLDYILVTLIVFLRRQPDLDCKIKMSIICTLSGKPIDGFLPNLHVYFTGKGVISD